MLRAGEDGPRRQSAQSADHLGEKRRQWGVVGEVVCVLGKTISDMVCCSHANPLVRALTGYIARKPAIPCLGGAAHAHISGLTCALADSGADQRAHVRMSGPRRAARNAGS